MDAGSVIYLSYQVLVLVGAGLSLAFGRKPITARKVVGRLLVWSLAVNGGLSGLLGFYFHAFEADLAARSIGWPPGSPFQFEVAVANLAFGVLGILCIWLRGLWWWATAVGMAVFLWGAAYGHIRDIIVNQNYAPGNAGVILYLDILIPAIHLILLVIYSRLSNQSAE